MNLLTIPKINDENGLLTIKEFTTEDIQEYIEAIENVNYYSNKLNEAFITYEQFTQIASTITTSGIESLGDIIIKDLQEANIEISYESIMEKLKAIGSKIKEWWNKFIKWVAKMWNKFLEFIGARKSILKRQIFNKINVLNDLEKELNKILNNIDELLEQSKDSSKYFKTILPPNICKKLKELIEKNKPFLQSLYIFMHSYITNPENVQNFKFKEYLKYFRILNKDRYERLTDKYKQLKDKYNLSEKDTDLYYMGSYIVNQFNAKNPVDFNTIYDTITNLIDEIDDAKNVLESLKELPDVFDEINTRDLVYVYDFLVSNIRIVERKYWKYCAPFKIEKYYSKQNELNLIKDNSTTCDNPSKMGFDVESIDINNKIFISKYLKDMKVSDWKKILSKIDKLTIKEIAEYIDIEQIKKCGSNNEYLLYYIFEYFDKVKDINEIIEKIEKDYDGKFDEKNKNEAIRLIKENIQSFKENIDTIRNMIIGIEKTINTILNFDLKNNPFIKT